MSNTVQREFISLASATSARNGAGFMPCQGLYHTPVGKQPKVAFIATHYNVDFAEHYLGDYMAARGYGYLGWNTRFRGNEAFFILEHALIDIGAGVSWLKERAGVEQVVIVGNSGGGSLMGAYQSQASDPNITATSTATDWTLSMFNPDNGPPYSPEFIARYRAAQEARNDRITDWCIGELARLAAEGYSDRAFNLYRTWADPRLLDGELDPSDRPVGVCYAGDPKTANYSPRGIGLTNTCRTWLSMWSLRESQCRGAPHLGRIRVPSLVVQSMGDTGVFPSDAHDIHEALAAEDKTLQFMAGDHYLTEPDGARDEVADRISGWLDGYGL
jgi:pimeloyl-ACP methyl ester carboxylesterase